MAKISAAVGFNEGTVDKGAGVWAEQFVEKHYYGEVLRNTRLLRESDETPNEDISVNNSISIVADPYANMHYFAIRFVVMSGVPWRVEEVEIQGRRLLLRLGGVYSGPRADPPADEAGDASSGAGGAVGV